MKSWLFEVPDRPATVLRDGRLSRVECLHVLNSWARQGEAALRRDVLRAKALLGIAADQ